MADEQVTNPNTTDHAESKAGIYIEYCDGDYDSAAEITKQIEKNGLNCYFRDRDGGTFTYLEDLVRQIKSCHLILFICTALKNRLTRLHQIQCLHHTYESKQLNLVFLLDGIEEEDLPAELKFVPHVCKSEKNYFNKLMDYLKAPKVSLSQLLPMGNISSGLLWNYFFGYLNLILSELPNEIGKWINDNPSKTIPKRLYLLHPKDINILNSLCDADERIKFVETLTIRYINRAGVIRRVYKNTIYKFCKDDKEYHFVAEYVSPLKTMKSIQNFKRNFPEYTEKAFEKQFEYFIEKLSEILKKRQLHNCTLISYDKDQSLLDILAEKIEYHLKDPATTQQTSQSAIKRDQSYEDQGVVYIAYADKDKPLAEKVVKEIEDSGLKCYFRDRDEVPGYEMVERCRKSCSCSQTLCIYSQNTLKDNKTKRVLLESFLFSGDPEELNVTFLLHGFEGKIPPELEGLHLIHGDNYLGELMDRLRATNDRMENLLPVGDIYNGLALSYYCGYLDLVLPEIQQRIDELVENSPKYKGISRSLYQVLPINAKCPDTFDEIDDRITHVETFITLKTDQAANKGREYKNTLYKISRDDKEYYIVAEFPPALKMMNEMVSEHTGLTESTLKKQVNLFKEKLSEILSHKDVPNKCCTLVIWDDTQRLSDLLVEEIKKEEKRMEEELGGITEKIASL